MYVAVTKDERNEAGEWFSTACKMALLTALLPAEFLLDSIFELIIFQAEFFYQLVKSI